METINHKLIDIEIPFRIGILFKEYSALIINICF